MRLLAASLLQKVVRPAPLLHPRRALVSSMASATQPRGAFIVFEGADRAGKSTQCQQLVAHLNASGVAAELWNFPDRTTAIGKMINAYLTSQADINDAAVHLLFSANRWEKRCVLAAAAVVCRLGAGAAPTIAALCSHSKLYTPPACSDELLRKLAAGTTLVVDRYAYSGVAFTAAKGAPGLDRAWCQAPDVGLPAPDAVFFLDLSVEAAAARGGYGEERYEKAEFQVGGRVGGVLKGGWCDCWGVAGELGCVGGGGNMARETAPCVPVAASMVDVAHTFQQLNPSSLSSALLLSHPHCPPTAPLQRKVLDQFHSMRDSSWRVIDASQPIEAIQQQLREQAAAVVTRCQRGAVPLGALWGGSSAAGGGAALADTTNT